MKRNSRIVLLAWLAALLLVAWVLRSPFLGRNFWIVDEGVTFTMAEQVRHGAVLYRDAADHRSPLVPYLKAVVFLVSGDWNLHAQHAVIALLMGATAFGLLVIARKLGDKHAGYWSALAFTLLVMVLPGPAEALAAHTESFLIVFSALGFCLVACAVRSGGFLLGTTIGLAFSASSLCKQPGLLDFGVALVVLALLAWRNPPQRARLQRVLAGTAVGFAGLWGVACLYFGLNHAWNDFVYYAWTYNTQVYVPEVPLLQRLAGMQLIWNLTRQSTPAVLILGAAGLCFGLSRTWRWFRRMGHPTSGTSADGGGDADNGGVPVLALLSIGWFAAGVWSTGLSGRPFSHYAIQAIPSLALLCGLALGSATTAMARSNFSRARRVVLGVAIVGLVFWTVSDARALWRELDPHDDAEHRVLRTLVQSYTTKQDRIWVWGYFPEAYAIAKRLPATRFVYTNFLTGLVPWTNLAPQVDTRYAIVPGAWEAFWQDYSRTPPEMILDSSMRGYAKYPLLAQPRLRDEVIDHFAEVKPPAGQTLQERVFRRVAATDPVLTAATSVPDERLRVSVQREPGQSDLVLAIVNAPDGTTEVGLQIGGRPYRQLRCRPDSPVEVRFLVRLSDLVVHGTKVNAIARCQGVVITSGPLDIARQLVLDLRSPEPSPVLDYSTNRLRPLAGAGPLEWHSERQENQPGWRHDGPFTLTFPRPQKMQVLQFDWLPAKLDEKDAPPANTELLEVRFESDFGSSEPLPLNVTASVAGMRHVVVELPRDESGKLVLSSTARGSVWIGNVNGYAHGPAMRFGSRLIRPAQAIHHDYERLVQNQDESWSIRAFGRLLYPREAGMERVVIEYSMPDPRPNPSLTDPRDVILEINYLHDNGRSENLMSRGMNPWTNPKDRGLQLSDMTLPEQGAGELEIRVVPLVRENPNDRIIIHRIRAQGAGPDLVLSADRVLIPLESTTVGSDRIRTTTPDGYWMAHPPASVAYLCPAELRAITIGFGLDPASYWDEKHGQRTDGIDVIVELTEPDGKTTELFQRSLDPFHVESDRGPQKARIALPGRAGRLTIRLTPGRYASSSFDWSYLTNFSGELAP